MARLSVTKRQRETEAGAELLALCQTVTEDGTLSDEEISGLAAWLEDHGGLPAHEHLKAVVGQVLADGRITPSERQELYRAIETVLPPDLRALVRIKRVGWEEQERAEARAAKEAAVERARIEKKRNAPEFYVNFMVAGRTYEGRPQLIARYVRVGDACYMRRDRGNQYSRNAIEVRTVSGHCVGYVPEEYATEVAPMLDAGHPHHAVFTKVLTGGRSPVPIVVASIFAKNATLPDLVWPGTDIPIAPAPAAAPQERSQIEAEFARIVTRTPAKSVGWVRPVVIGLVVVLLFLIALQLTQTV